MFQYFDELFAGASYIRLRQNIMLMICLDFQFCAIRYTGRFKEKGDKLIPVLLDAAGQPENTDCEN